MCSKFRRLSLELGWNSQMMAQTLRAPVSNKTGALEKLFKKLGHDSLKQS